MVWRILMAATVLVTAGAARAAYPFPWDLEAGREAGLLGAAGATFLVGKLAGGDAPPETGVGSTPLDRAQVNALDRGATRRWSPAADRASDYLVWTQMAAPVALMVTAPGREYGGRLALIYTETLLLNAGTTFALKNICGRRRPFVFNEDPRIPDALRYSASARRSFPSGHTANAFASMVFFATTFEQLYPDSSARGRVWGGCLATAGTTGLLRYLAGRHYPTDILAGAVLGATIGWLVPRLHEVDETSSSAPGGLKVAWGFGF